MYFEQLIDSVESSAAWRADKAAQYPDDTRNARCSEALGKLGENLRALSANDKHVTAYESAVERLYELDETATSGTEFESSYISRYGFDYPENGEPLAFLAGLIEEYESLVGELQEKAREEERTREYEALRDTAPVRVKAAARECAMKAADDIAKVAAERAYKKAYGDAYEEAYRDALIKNATMDTERSRQAMVAAARCAADAVNEYFGSRRTGGRPHKGRGV